MDFFLKDPLFLNLSRDQVLNSENAEPLFCLVARPRDSKDMVLRRRKPYVLIQLSKEGTDTYLFSPYFL